MKTALAAVALTLALATPASAGETVVLLGELSALSDELVAVAELAPAHGSDVKATFLAELVVRDFRELQLQLLDYVMLRDLELPRVRQGDARERLEHLWGRDFDRDLLEELVTRCEAKLTAVDDALHANALSEQEDVELDALLRLAFHTLNATAADARRMRGEYVPLSKSSGR